MKITYNFEEVEEALYEQVKPKIEVKKHFWDGAVVLTGKNFKEVLSYIESLESDLELLRNFIKIQKKLDDLKTKDTFSFDNYIKITSEDGFDEEFEQIRDEFEKKLLEENKERE